LLLCPPLHIRYYANWQQPRHESYREDVETAVNATGSSHPSNPAAAALYRELASGAESGWDYSSRWFADGKTLGTIRTTQVWQGSMLVTLLFCWFRSFLSYGAESGWDYLSHWFADSKP
jgi:neutral trehalase